MRKVPHLAMCGDFTLFMGCNISTFCSLLLVGTFPTELVSPLSEFICKCYEVSGSFVLLSFQAAVVPLEAAVVPLHLVPALLSALLRATAGGTAVFSPRVGTAVSRAVPGR